MSPEGFSVVRKVYIDDSCSTPAIGSKDEPEVFECQGTDRKSILVQGTYDVVSFVSADSSGMPDRQGTCDPPSEPASI